MTGSTIYRRGRAAAALLLIAAGSTACALVAGGMGMLRGVHPPADSEFGLGPRSSVHGHYRATIVPARPLAKGALQTVRLSVVDDAGKGVDGARITIDGGMPQHGHGLPTRPRVSPAPEGGAYVVAGLRFNMGGWWVLKFAIAASAGTDSVTFNVRL